MKFKFVATALVAPVILFAQKGEFSIKGKIGTLSSPAKVYLTYPTLKGPLTDSSAIENGTFTFKGTIEEPVQGTIVVNYLGSGKKGKVIHRRTIYLEPVTMKIKGEDSLSNAIVSGSKINSDYDNLVEVLKPSTDKMNVFMADYFALPKDKQQDSAVRAVLDKKYNAIDEEQKVAYTSYIKSHPNSIVSLDALKKMGGSIPEYSIVAPLFESFSKQLKNSAEGKEYGEELAKLKTTAIGAVAPEFTQNGPEGNPVKLSSFRGKYLLVDFWASWCVPCRAENPNVVKAYSKYHEKGFEILSVSLDDEKAKNNWLNAIKKDGLIWSQVSDLKGWSNEAAQLYAIRAIPQNFLLDPNGKIIAKNLRAEALDKKLDELFQP